MMDLTSIANNLGPGFEQSVPMIAALLVPLLLLAIILAIGAYIYTSLTMYITAKKLGTTPAWLAWIPFINLALQAKMAKMSWLPLLALIFVWIPVLGMLIAFGIQVLAVIWLWKICEARGKEGWFSLLTLIPFLGGIWSLVLWGLLAWDDPKVPENKSPQKKAAKKKTAKKAIKK